MVLKKDIKPHSLKFKVHLPANLQPTAIMLSKQLFTMSHLTPALITKTLTEFDILFWKALLAGDLNMINNREMKL